MLYALNPSRFDSFLLYALLQISSKQRNHATLGLFVAAEMPDQVDSLKTLLMTIKADQVNINSDNGKLTETSAALNMVDWLLEMAFVNF